MNPTREIAMVVGRELGRNLRSAKGLVLGVLCMLGGAGTAFVVVSSQKYAEKQFQGVHSREMREQAIAAMYDKDIGKAFGDVPEILFIMMFATVGFAALLAALVAFDAISGELQHRSVRYWAVRARRSSYVLGKYFGVFAVTSIMTLSMHLVSWVVTIVRGDYPLGVTVTWGIKLWLLTLPVSAAWCALSTFVSTAFKTPILALLVTFAASFAIWLTYTIGRVTDSKEITWVHPGGWDRLLLSPTGNKALIGLAASAGFTALFVSLAIFLFTQRDL